jgi:hypothetical protein
MGMLYDFAYQLVESSIVLLQLFVFAALLPVWVLAYLIVVVINVLLAGTSRGPLRTALLMEPWEWATHQMMVGLGADMDFWAVPYLGR